MPSKEGFDGSSDIPVQRAELTSEEFADEIRRRSDELSSPGINNRTQSEIFQELEKLCLSNPTAYTEYMQKLVTEQQTTDQSS